MEEERPVRFIDIVKESDPDCCLYNYAAQGEFDFGFAAPWSPTKYTDGKVFHCFEEHKRFIESRFKTFYVMQWEPTSDWSEKDEVSSLYLEAVKAISDGEILDDDQGQVINAISTLRERYGVSVSDILAHRQQKPH